MLWLLVRNGFIGYDEADAFVVRASSSEAARKLAADEAGDEGASEWLDLARSSCTRLTSKGVEGTILRSFNAG